MCNDLHFSTKFQVLTFFFLLSSATKTTPVKTPPLLTAGTATGSSSSNVSNSGCGCSVPPSPSPQPPSPDLQPSDFVDKKIYQAYKVIQRFKATITSDPFNITQSWVGSDVCNSYQGFYCDNPPYNRSAIALAAIDFNGYGLGAPSITEFISQLPDLAFFHVNSNKFKGTIPSEVANLPFFYELDVSNNLMTGPFPTSVLSISKLTFLDLRFNSFTGSVPPQLFSLNLEVLFINNNQFMQTLPDNLWKSDVNYITLANNRFTGSIPCSIANASKSLIEVLLLNNELSGCLPYEVGLLENATVFDAGYNWLTGPIPYSFGCMSSVEQLNLAGNYLYGEIPEVVCKLGSLLNLSLSDNYFTTVGPICRKLIRKGVLDDRKNCIMGRPMQRSPIECIAFFLKPNYCRPGPSYYYIPCQHSWEKFFHHRSRSWPSYKAFNRHRL